MAGPAYQVRMADPMLETTLPEADWKDYFDNISMTAQASCASAASTLGLTPAHMNLVMSVDNNDNIVPGDHLNPMITVNDRIYDSGNDTLRLIGRFLCGSFPVSENLHGDGMGVASQESRFERSDDAIRNIGLATANHCVCPDALTALTHIIKGYPAECLFPTAPEGHPTKGIGISIASFPDNPDNRVGISEVTFDTYIVHFSRPYDHIPVVCVNSYDSEVSVLEVTPTLVRLHVHSGNRGLNVSFSLLAIGYIA